MSGPPLSAPTHTIQTVYAFMEKFMWHDTSSESCGTLKAGIRACTPSKQGIVVHDQVDEQQQEMERYVMLQQHQHFENSETKRRIHNMLEVSDLLFTHLFRVPPPMIEPAPLSFLEKFHTKEYLQRIKQMSENGMGGNAGHAPFGPGSFEIAQYAVGACFSCADEIMRPDNGIKNGYALVRPPGHHAERDIGLGFCLLANVALTAIYLKEKYHLKKVAIVDFDAHHGNGTQQAFYNDPNVLFMSVHQDRNYPTNSGLVTEIGEGAGEGYTINIPLPAGSGVGAYEYVTDRVFVPALLAFEPEFILVSCGFDANAFDPLARMMLCSSTYQYMTKNIMQVASTVCQDRMLYVHEGGYSPVVVPMCGLKTIETLCGIEDKDSKVEDPFDAIIKRKGGQELKDAEKLVVDEAHKVVQKYLL